MSLGRNFWLPTYWGHVFNQRRIVNGKVSYHRGHDISLRGATPALRAGRVVRHRRSSVLGLVVTVEVRPGVFDHYAHQRSPKPIGYRVRQFETVSYNETSKRLAGTAWTGPHCHFTTGGDAAWYGVGVLNATSLIQQVIAATKPGGSKPATPKPPVVIRPPAKPLDIPEDDMRTSIVFYGGNSKPEWTVTNPQLDGGYFITTDREEAIAVSRIQGAGAGVAPASFTVTKRADLIAIQRAAAKLHNSYVATQRKILGK